MDGQAMGPGASVADRHDLAELVRQFGSGPSWTATGAVDPALAMLLAEATRVSRGAVVITDAELDEPGPRVVWVNTAFERLTGYQADQLVGRSPRLLQGPGTDRAVLAGLRSQLESGEDFEGEAINYRADGSAFLMSWRITAIRNADGVATHYVSMQEDVTAARLRGHEDREAILALQESLVAAPPDLVGPFETGAAYRPAKGSLVGGDWVDVVADPELDTVRLVVGDVTGHGTEAVAAMGQLRWATQAGAFAGLDLPATMHMLRKLARVQGLVATLLMVDLDPDGALVYLGAGHPPAMIVGPGGALRELATTTPLLGVDGVPNRTATDGLAPGEVLVAYTDGLIERRGRTIDEGLLALRTFLTTRLDLDEPPTAIACTLVEELVDFDPGEDDAAVLVVRQA